MEIKNLKEAKQLVKKYRSITVPMIREMAEATMRDVIEKITGFGWAGSCSLCENIECEECIYGVLTRDACDDGINSITYDNICDAKNPKELKKAVGQRADYIEKLIKQV